MGGFAAKWRRLTVEQQNRSFAIRCADAQDDALQRGQKKESDILIPEQKKPARTMSFRGTAQRFPRNPFCGGLRIVGAMAIETDPCRGGTLCQEIDPLQFVQGTFFTNGKGNRACSSRAICCVPDQQPPEGFSLDRRCLTGYTALSEGRMIRSFLPIPSRPSPVKRQPVKYRMSRPAGKSMISLLFLL